MKVNGKTTVLTDAKTLEDFLKDNNYNLSRIAVERNGEIIPKGNFDRVILSDADCQNFL